MAQPRPRVYLSGPVTGGSHESIETWRHLIAARLSKIADVVDPASYEYDAKIAYASTETSDEALTRLQHGRYVVDRNKLLISGSDLLLANFLEGSQRASIGSVAEIFLAYALERPIVIVRQEHGNVHDHAMINAVATKVCYSLDEGIAALAELGGIKMPRRRKTQDLAQSLG
jgi:hypothetical protein